MYKLSQEKDDIQYQIEAKDILVCPPISVL